MTTRKGLTGIVSIILLLAISIALISVLFYSVNQYDFTSDDITNPTVSYNPVTDKYTLIKNPDNVPVGVGSTDDNNLNRQFASVGDSLTATNAVLAKTGDSLTVIRDESGNNFIQAPENLGQIHSTMSGSGTNSDPYIVTNLSQLQSIKHELNGIYRLENNIQASSTQQWNSGKGFNPIGVASTDPFSGQIRGNGKTISGLYIKRDVPHVGLVGVLFGDSAKVKNLRVVNAEIESLSDNNGANAGIVVTKLKNGAVDSVYASGTVTALQTPYVGGISGRVSGAAPSSLRNSYSSASVQSNRETAGGLVGQLFTGSVEDSFSVGEVSGSATNTGGVIGRKSGGNTQDLYWDKVASGQSSSAAFSTTGFDTDSDSDGRADEMIGSSASSNMGGLDFSNTWITQSGDYPELRVFE